MAKRRLSDLLGSVIAAYNDNRLVNALQKGGSGDASNLSVTAQGGTTARTLAARAAEIVNVADVGLVSAFSAANGGKKIIVPPGTWTTSATLRIPDGAEVEFLGRSAVVAYTGTGTLFEIRSSKNVRIDKFNADLSGAGTSAEALHVYGCWYCDIFSPRVVLNGASQAGFVLETSESASQGWGTYIVEVINPQIIGAGLYGIRTFQTAGDTGRSVTHLNIRGGWSKGVSYGLDLNNVSTGRVEGWAADSGIDAIRVTNSTDLMLSPGELGPGTGYGINFGVGNAAISLVSPSHAGIGGSLGYQNNTTYTPVTFDQSKTRLYASRSNQNYYAELGVNLQYNSTSGYLSFLGGNAGAARQAVGFTQNFPTASGMFQIGEPTQAAELVLGRGNTTATDTTGFVQVPSAPTAPTSTPTGPLSGRVPIVFDLASKQLVANFGVSAVWTPFISASSTTGITAAGSTQATATALTTRLNIVRTVGAGTGVVLSSTLGGPQIVVNRSAASLLVYPPSAGLIDDGAANAAVTIAAGGSQTFERYPGTVSYFTAGKS